MAREIKIVDNEIIFKGETIAFLNYSASNTLKGEFCDNIEEIIFNDEKMQELKKILCDLQYARSELESAEGDLEYFLYKMKGGKNE